MNNILSEADLQKLYSIFFPYAEKRSREVRTNGTRFVHYTTAASAAKILKSREFWMREPYCMNDYMEIEHGLSCLNQVYNYSETGKKFKTALNSISHEISDKIELHFNHSPFNPRMDKYIACISEHKDEEDAYGRLSMWRAYGCGSGVALVMNASQILNGPNVLKIQTSPVAYFENQNFESELFEVTKNIDKSIEFLKSVDSRYVNVTILNMLRLSALSTKHPGFSEEREWRLIYSPQIEPSEHMAFEIKIISGIPQRIFKIPLKNTPSGIKTGGEIPDLVDRIIIGPTQYSDSMQRAFTKLLGDVGVQNPEKKVFISRIPLRT